MWHPWVHFRQWMGSGYRFGDAKFPEDVACVPGVVERRNRYRLFQHEG